MTAPAKEQHHPPWRDLAHLLVLCSFALAQPVFEVISNTPEFFSVRDTRNLEIWLFGVVLILAPAAILALLELLAGLIGASLRRGVHLAFVAVLLWLIALQALKRLEEAIGGDDPAVPGALLIVLATAAAAGAMLLYVRQPAARTLVTFLLPAPLLFLVLFGQEGRPSVSESGPGAGRDVPVVVVIFDELPTLSLMNSREQIDGARYPGFAELARTSTWYRNAITVHDETNFAVPAILAGQTPALGRRPVAGDYPKNLFTLLRRSHRLQVREPYSSLCPRKLCPPPRNVEFGKRFGDLLRDAAIIDLRFTAPRDIEDDLPDVPRVGRGAESEERRFQNFVEDLPAQAAPVLSFIHFERPHHPWSHLPSGPRYVSSKQEAPPYGLRYPHWRSHSWLVRQGWQRHLLAVGNSDRLLGTLLRRMKQMGTFDESLVVVAADHGVSFRPGGLMRYVDEANLAEIGSVPVFVKGPGQRRGQVVDFPLRTADILPLISRVVGLEFKGENPGQPGGQVIVRSARGGQFGLPWQTFLRDRRRVLAEKARLFGEGRDGPGLYALDARPDLSGVDELALRARGFRRANANIDSGSELVNVRPDAPLVPAFVFGKLLLPPGERDREVAVLLNGRVAGTAMGERNPGEERFSLIIAPDKLRRGRNEVQIFVRDA